MRASDVTPKSRKHKKKRIHSADHYNYYIINSIIVWKSYIHTHSNLQRSTCMGDRGEPIARKKRWFRFLRFELYIYYIFSLATVIHTFHDLHNKL